MPGQATTSADNWSIGRGTRTETPSTMTPSAASSDSAIASLRGITRDSQPTG